MDLITLGEALIDFPATQNGVSLAEAQQFLKVPAGATANVAAAATRLGLQAAFITKVGDDAFGESILKTFHERGIDISQAKTDPDARTGLAFVSLQEDGERDFLFYFEPARDLALRPDELDVPFLEDTRAFHYGSISLIAEPCRTTTLTAARIAHEAGALISYDPNLRPRLWPDLETMHSVALAGFAEADLVKVSREEVFALAPDFPDDLSSATYFLDNNPRLKLLCVSDGERGSAAFWRLNDGSVSSLHMPGFSVAAIDATGAGDAFMAGIITFLLQKSSPQPINFENFLPIAGECLEFANACGAVAATERGAAMQDLSLARVAHLVGSRNR